MTARKRTPQHLFFNRDQSWMQFNARVLEEAQDESNPLLERVHFLAITASNLDEFVEIRVAGQLQLIENGQVDRHNNEDDGMTPQQRLETLTDAMHSFVYRQHDCWGRQLVPALTKANINLYDWDELSTQEREFALDFFDREVDPLLTPVTIDPSNPFPRVLNKALCMAVLLRRKGQSAKKFTLGIVTVPRSLPRYIRLPRTQGHAFLPLQDLIAARMDALFPGYQVLASTPFRITRNSNLYMQEEESQSVLETVRAELHNRRKGDVVRMEVEPGADEQIVHLLRVNFDLARWQIFRTGQPINLARVEELYKIVDEPSLKFPAFRPKMYQLPEGTPDLFAQLRREDILLYHPFDCYDTVEKFVESVELDPRVLTAKQTLYRTSSDSPAFESLLEAGRTKDITVVVELMARFDEDSNIRWARALEEAGVQVFHGIVGRKTHCKLALLVRRDEDGVVRRYAHLGTGNYNRNTARFYTDLSLMTARPEITAAVHRVFHYLTADAEKESFRPLLVAPMTLAEDLLGLIRRETRYAREGKKAYIIAKMNGLLDGKTIRALYAASQAGVQIDLIVRGMCALRPGVPGLSENIRVRSIVGRFLEHSRIFCFANAGQEVLYAGSADWMPRNLYSRCETVFPILEAKLRQRLRDEILFAYLKDNVKARLLEPDGEYVRAPQTQPLFCAQQYLMQIANSGDAAVPPLAVKKKASRKAAKKTSAKAITRRK